MGHFWAQVLVRARGLFRAQSHVGVRGPFPVWVWFRGPFPDRVLIGCKVLFWEWVQVRVRDPFHVLVWVEVRDPF